MIEEQTERCIICKELTCVEGYVELIEITTFEKSHSFDYRIDAKLGPVEIMNDTFESESAAYAALHSLVDSLSNFVPA